MKNSIGTKVKVNNNKNSESDFGFIAKSQNNKKLVDGHVWINITKDNSVGSRKGIYQFNEKYISVV